MYCPNCGSQNPDHARYCLVCGDSIQEEPKPAQAQPSRPIWPWILVCVLSLTAAVLAIVLVLRRNAAGDASAAPKPEAVSPSSAAAESSPLPAAALPSPTSAPTITIITPSPVIPVTPSPAPVTPVPPSPTPAVPDEVKVFYYTKELDEFTEAEGNSLHLSAKAYPEESFTNATLVWTVSDPSVIKLEPDSYGRTCIITILKVHSGPVTLTVSCNGVKKDVKVYTKSASTPTPAPGAVTLDKNTLYRINIFLSNFSEQQIQTFTTATCADDYLLRFVELYLKINENSRISLVAGEECMSLEDANTYMKRFFGRTVSPYEGATYLLDAWNSFRYSGGCFRFPAADGGSFNRFTVVYEMNAKGDGTYTVSFQVFELDITEYWDKGMDNALYWLSNDEVAALVWSGRVKPVQGGTAVVKDYTFNGKSTYQILSYEVWDIVF